MQRTVWSEISSAKKRELRLEDYPLKKIQLDDITREIHGTTLLKVAQKARNQAYLNHFYALASDSPNTDDNALYTKFYFAIHCFQDAATLDAILAHASWENFLMFFDNSEGTTAFFTALQLENIVAMDCLLRKNIHIMLEPNADRILPPHFAAQHGKLKVLDFCLTRLGQEYISTCEKIAASTILHTAIENNQVKAAKTIIAASLNNMDATDQYGYTPLHLAVLTQSEELVSLLLSKNADTTLATDNSAKHPNQTALQLAAATGNNTITLLLLAHALHNTVSTPETAPATLFSDFKALLGLIANPVNDTTQLSEHLKLLFVLLNYAKGRNEEGAYISYPYLASVANSFYNTIYDDKDQLVYSIDSKLKAVWLVISNIINGNTDPVANCDDKQKAILQDGRLKALTKSLFPCEETLSRRASPSRH